MKTAMILALVPAFVAVVSARAAPMNNNNYGSAQNPVKMPYNANTQPEQNAILQQNPGLTQPMEAAFAYGETSTGNRRTTYKAHGAADPGKSKEDQPPASFRHQGQPGALYNVNPSEQKEQAKAAGKAVAEAKKAPGGNYIQQVPDNSKGKQKMPSAIPKKKGSGSKKRRSLFARAAAAKAFNDVYDNYHNLMKRSADPLDFDSILSDLYARDAEPEASYFEDDDVELFVKRDAYIEPEYTHLYARDVDSYLYW